MFGQRASPTWGSSLPGTPEVAGLGTELEREPRREGRAAAAAAAGLLLSSCSPAGGRLSRAVPGSRYGPSRHSQALRPRPCQSGPAARAGEDGAGPGPEAAFRPPFPAQSAHRPPRRGSSAPAPAPAGPADACELGPPGPCPASPRPAPPIGAPTPPRRGPAPPRGGRLTSHDRARLQPDVTYPGATSRRRLQDPNAFWGVVGPRWAALERWVRVSCSCGRDDPFRVRGPDRAQTLCDLQWGSGTQAQPLVGPG